MLACATRPDVINANGVTDNLPLLARLEAGPVMTVSMHCADIETSALFNVVNWRSGRTLAAADVPDG